MRFFLHHQKPLFSPVFSTISKTQVSDLFLPFQKAGLLIFFATVQNPVCSPKPLNTTERRSETMNNQDHKDQLKARIRDLTMRLAHMRDDEPMLASRMEQVRNELIEKLAGLENPIE